MKTAEIREKFLSFFESKGHSRVKSSSLVPYDDPTLLFTNAGMNQFKDVFLGLDKRSYTRATSSQKCVRAGGKHNDLENVGYTARHLTFFEMLGNFSFGDYFKEKAIEYAWEFLTSKDWLAIDKERLLVTVYAEDDEAYSIWQHKIGLAEDKIIRIGDNKGARYASDNFWQMGDTGPCGPCSEIFYDHGEAVFGGPPGSKDEDGDRFIEIWNCVFMQYNRDESGQMKLLPKPSVDTGMGLERITAVMQQQYSNFEIDLFQQLIKAVAREVNVSFDDNPSLNVIADHIRACSFLIADGVLPGNEGRSYVLRRIIRRAVRHGYKLGQKNSFFYKLVPDLIQQMGTAYPELIEKKAIIQQTLQQEEVKFAQTLSYGMNYLANNLPASGGTLSGLVAFKLYDTYGFPLDLTIDICRENSITVDEVVFDQEMEAQKQRAKQASNFKLDKILDYAGASNQFVGYEQHQCSAKVLALYTELGEAVQQLEQNQSGIVVLDKTPFYAESGGQIGDVGYLQTESGIVFEVKDTQKIKTDVFGHYGMVVGSAIKVSDDIDALVDKQVRVSNMRNHSATHLLHAALRKLLGTQVEQRGSLVSSQRLRFDFTHGKPLTKEALKQIEILVNQQIMENFVIDKSMTSYDNAINQGAMALFGEKYGEEVRVVKMGDFSIELCGGTHVNRTGDIGFFKIISESGIAAGIRRIEAITGNAALHWIQQQESLVLTMLQELKAQTAEDLLAKIDNVLQTNKRLEKSLIQSKIAMAKQVVADLIGTSSTIGRFKLIVQQVPFEAGVLREMVTELTGQQDNLVVLLYSIEAGKVSFCAGVTKKISNKVKAGDLVKYVAEQLGGKGGGRADLAQAAAAAVNSDKLSLIINSIGTWLREKATVN